MTWDQLGEDDVKTKERQCHTAPPLVWMTCQPSYGPPYYQAFAGPILIGAVHMSLRSWSAYEIGSGLPQIRVPHNRFPTIDEAKRAVEDLWGMWYKAIHQPTINPTQEGG